MSHTLWPEVVPDGWPEVLSRFDVRGLLEFPIDFKKATSPTIPALLDEQELLHELRFGDINLVDEHG